MYYVRFPLSLRQVEYILHERGIDICHETVRYWWNRFGPLFANELKKWRIRHMFWFEVALEAYVSTCRNKAVALPFLGKALRRYGNPDEIVTDRCPSYGAA